jgi:hypothetical protein
MEFTFTVRYPDGGGDRSQHDLPAMKTAVTTLAGVLEALTVGETVTIERIA